MAPSGTADLAAWTVTEPRRRLLKERRRRLVDEAAARMVSEQPGDPAAALGEIRAIDEVLAALPRSPWQRLRRPLAVGLACVLLAGAAWMLTIDRIGLRTPLTLSAEATSATITTARDWSTNGAVALVGPEKPEIRIEEAVLLFSDPAKGFDRLDASFSLRARSDDMAWSRLHAPLATSITFEKKDGRKLDLYLRGSTASGDIQLRRRVELKWRSLEAEGGAAAFETPVLEHVTFQVLADQSKAVPAHLALWPEDDLAFTDIPVSRVVFLRDRSFDDVDEASHASTLLSGSLRLRDVDKTTALARGDHVIMSGVEGRVRQLLIGERISVEFEGSVDSVVLGASDERRTLTPTLLAYVFHNQRLDFLFVAASFVWGMIWSLARLLDV